MLKSLSIVPRSLIFAIDLVCSFLALLFSLIVFHHFNFTLVNFDYFLNAFWVVGTIQVFSFFIFTTFSGIVRYTSTKDGIRIFLSILTVFISLSVYEWYWSEIRFNPYLHYNVFAVYSIALFLGLMSYRLVVKHTFSYLKNLRVTKKNVIIYGAASAGIAAKRALEGDQSSNFSIVAFIDDNPKKVGKVLDGIKIYSFEKLNSLVTLYNVEEVIVASFSLPVDKKNKLVDFCLNHELKVLSIPNYKNWNEGGFSIRQLRKINIEELLERAPINIHNFQIKGQIKGKRILVTGAAGSIGSEIVKQLIDYSPEMIIMCDQAETALHHLELWTKTKETNVNCVPFLGDIKDKDRMRFLFNQFNPHYVYHAAAYKHVPMMELNPTESIKTNLLGTKNIVDLALLNNIERFVMVSTDKAVNPTNVMGATKRFAEMYVQALSLNRANKTKFITTRFGNVLGSNGSVIIRFKEQIEAGGPITVTHPNITRYFMTIPEACQLVLEAGSMGNGGEIFVFDMGDPVLISDLAKKMIRLYGLVPNIDINIEYTGLRPGEKLYEQLLNDGENTIKTYHDKILISKVKSVDFEQLQGQISDLESSIEKNESDMVLVAKMKEIIPEYVSNNSIFEKLDKSGKLIALK